MTDATVAGQSEFAEIALTKLVRVLGTSAGQRVLDETLRQIGLQRIQTADDLWTFGDVLSRKTGFEAAVGGLLTVAAVLRGAAGKPTSGS